MSVRVERNDRAFGAEPVEIAPAQEKVPSIGVAPQAAPGDVGRNDAAALQALLQEEFGASGGRAQPLSATAAAEPVRAVNTLAIRSHWPARLLKSALGLALLVGVGIMPAQRLFQVSSVEAVINARLVTLRSPIDGVV